MSSKETLNLDSTDSKTSESVLDILDTYHDFCKGERKKKSKGVDEDSGDKRVTIMRTYLPLLLKKKYTNFERDANYTDNVKTLSKDKITSVSKIEHETIDLFEEKYKTEIQAAPETKEVLTMEEIISSYKKNKDENNNTLWKKFKNNSANRVIEIQKDGIELEKEDCKALSSFILNYFFFTSTQKDIHVTFDAADGTVGEIFRDDDKVKNIIFPQTIADSATTSLNVLKGRCDYIFPSVKNEIDFKSNEFSHKDYRIFFRNDSKAPFGNTNPYGFSIVIEKKGSDKKREVEIPFSSTQTEGPSVNYIIDILNTLQKSSTDKIKLAKIAKKSSIVNLALALDKYPPMKEILHKEIRKQENGILPDLKRGGDHEAVNAAKYVIESRFPYTIFTTIDMLCALKARKEKINTIWQTSERLVLYRFPTIPGEKQEKYSFILKVFNCLDLITKIESILVKKQKTAGKSLLQQELERQIQEIDRKGLDGVADIAIERDKRNERCLKVLNALLRIRQLDLKLYIENLNITISDVDEAKISEIKRKLSIFANKNQNDLLESELLKKTGNESSPLAYFELQEIEITVKGKKQKKQEERQIISASELTESQNKLLEYYNKLLNDLKENINIDIHIAEENLAEKLKIYKPLVQDKIVTRTNSSKVTFHIFLKTDHSTFDYLTGPFFRFYDMMLLVEDLVESSSSKRDFPIKIKKFLQKDKTNLYSYFDIVDEILEQFQTEEIINKLIEIFHFEEKALNEASSESTKTGSVNRDDFMRYFFLGRDEIPAKAGKAKQNKINGVLDSLLEYYTILNTEIKEGKKVTQPKLMPYDMKTMIGGSLKRQRGGADEKYYELSDLLYKTAITDMLTEAEDG
jgi:hypothetical protein